MSRIYKHLFGPVPSRRLGKSLGVDLVPHKLCPIDCVYCEVGPTTQKTIERREYVPVEEVLEEVRAKLAENVPIDIITLSGSGEPTLHSGVGRVIRGIKEMTRLPVAVLTNGNLLYDPQVRRDILPADLVLPSLDAGDAETYARINRPCEQATFERLIAGLKAFRAEYPGRIRLEVFFVAGINDTADQARKIRSLIDQIKPDQIDVNSIARPPAEPDARAVPFERLGELAAILGDKAEVIASRPRQEQESGIGNRESGKHSQAADAQSAPTQIPVSRPPNPESRLPIPDSQIPIPDPRFPIPDSQLPTPASVSPDAVLALLRRRGCRAEDVAKGLSAPRERIDQLLADLVARHLVTRQQRPDGEYFVIAG